LISGIGQVGSEAMMLAAIRRSGDPATLDRAGRLVGRAQLLGALPGDVDLVVSFVGGDRVVESGALAVGEVLGAAAQDRAGAGERFVLAAAVAVDLLLHPAPHLVHGLGAELDDVERVEHRDSVWELVVDGVLVPWNGSRVTT
jgi:hypothetical protein